MRHLLLVLTCSFVAVLATGFVPSAHAFEVWGAADCQPSTNVNNFGPSANREIFVYVENDFAAEMTACTPLGAYLNANGQELVDDGEISESEVRALIEQTMEKWNQQSTGATFHFGGIVSEGSPSLACLGSEMPKRPAVLVNFHGGCKDVSGSCESAAATADMVTSDCGKITVWGDNDTEDACTSNARPWNINAAESRDEDIAGERLRTALLHEFGHMQEIGHPADASPPDDIETAIMRGAVVVDQPSRGHLLSYDKDCARHEWGQRDLDYKLMWAYDHGTYYGTSTHSYGSPRGFVSGGAARTDPNGYYGLYDPEPEVIFGLYTNSYFDYGTAVPIGSGSASINSWTSLDVDLRNAHVTPSVSFYDTSYSVYSRMMVHLEGSAPGSHYEPPRLLSGVSSDLFGSVGTIRLSRCVDSSSPCTQNPVETHLPLSVTHDPVSGEMVVVRVNTFNSGDFQRGSIQVHPGFDSFHRLNLNRSLSTSTTNRPGDSSNLLDYRMETELPVGVACTYDTSTYPYNCLLAWVDRGVYSGRVLYTYFRIVNGQVDWLGQAYARGGSETNSGVQAAYSWGRFRMAWKKRFGADRVEYTSTTGGYTSWTSPLERSAPGIVDTPTYLYHHLSLHTAKTDRNHAIVWTAADISDN